MDRFHGPDDITRPEKGAGLAEWEGKGTRRNSTAVAKDNKGNRQGSSIKNARRAEQMVTDKAKKIGQPSNRQGGPYTREEIDLWQEIKDLSGEKQHISVHTNTETGRVRVFRRDHRGIIQGDPLDEFTLENFKELKEAIGEAIKK